MKQYAITGILIAIAFVAGLMLYLVQPSAAQSGTTSFTSVRVRNDLTVVDDATFGSDTTFTPQTGIVVTNSATFTPTGRIQPISATGNATPTLAIMAAGKITTIYNTSTSSILLVDSSTRVMGGNLTLGQYDSITFHSDGTRMIEDARSNN